MQPLRAMLAVLTAAVICLALLNGAMGRVNDARHVGGAPPAAADALLDQDTLTVEAQICAESGQCSTILPARGWRWKPRAFARQVHSLGYPALRDVWKAGPAEQPPRRLA